ncbi:MAG: hypothetical protein ACKO7Z_05455, partial [Cyanobacteriota bacterium]
TYRNARANTPSTAAIELDAGLNRAVNPLFLDQAELHPHHQPLAQRTSQIQFRPSRSAGGLAFAYEKTVLGTWLQNPVPQPNHP